MKREAINHTKMRRLARALGVKMWGARGIMESVWSLTRDEAPAGNIGKLSDADIADFVGWDDAPHVLIDALVASGWVDVVQPYRLLIHDWPDHCEDYIHSRLAVAGLLFANGAVPKTRKLNQEQRKSIPVNPALPNADGSAQIAAIPADKSAPVAATDAEGSAPVAAENAEPYLTLPSLTEPSHKNSLPPDGGGKDPDEPLPPDPPSVVRPPVPPEEKTKSETAIAAESAINAAAAKIHAQHPAGPRRDISANAVSKALTKILRHKHVTVRQVPEMVAEIVRVHAAWCATESWQKSGGEFAKGLENWLCASKGRYETAPVVSIREPVRPIPNVKPWRPDPWNAPDADLDAWHFTEEQKAEIRRKRELEKSA